MSDTHDERGGDESAALTVAQYADRYMAYGDGRSDMDPGRPPIEAMWRVRKQLRHLRKQLAAATARAEKAEALAAELGEPETQLRIIGPSGAAYTPTGLDLHHRSEWLPGVRLEERQVYPTPWREAADAAQDGLSATETLQDPFGVAFHGNTSSITPQGLSEAEGGCPWCGTLQKLDADGLVLSHEHPTYCDECPGATRRPNDTTEDGQHG